MVYYDSICATRIHEGRGDMAKEAKARILINDFLRRSGWRFFDDESGPANLALETNVKLFDFFAVCEYFEEKFNYDEVVEFPPLRSSKDSDVDVEGRAPSRPPDFTNVNPDPLKTIVETPVPVYGMKIDRKFFERFEDKNSGRQDTSDAPTTGFLSA